MADKKEYVKLWLSYRSYFEPYSAAEVGRLVLAMMEYRASGVEPEFSGSERFVWPAIRRDIDESIAAQEEVSAQRSSSGKLGGRPKHEKANAFNEKQKKQMLFEESKKSYGQGQGQGQGNGQGQGHCPPLPPTEQALADVMTDFISRINPTAPQYCLEELAGYVKTVGPDVCKRAFDVALAEKKTTWSYIRAILADKQAKGVKCLADWGAADASRKQTGKCRSPNNMVGVDFNPSPDHIQKTADWLDKFLEEQNAETGN